MEPHSTIFYHVVWTRGRENTADDYPFWSPAQETVPVTKALKDIHGLEHPDYMLMLSEMIITFTLIESKLRDVTYVS